MAELRMQGKGRAAFTCEMSERHAGLERDVVGGGQPERLRLRF
jgi:hypothetical protein